MPWVLPAGSHILTATATDRAGNTGVASSAQPVLVGSAAADVLTPGHATNLVLGGLGDDIYNINRASIAVIESTGEGTDTVRASVGYTLPTGSSIEFLQANAGATGLALTGNALANTIVGGGGADIITGGLGADMLTGGAGADTFVFTAAGDSTVGVGGRDRISDFSMLFGDRIDLRLIDANPYVFGDQAFSFIGQTAFAGSAGELRQEAIGADTWVQADVNGDAVADFSFLLSGSHTLSALNFNL